MRDNKERTTPALDKAICDFTSPEFLRDISLWPLGKKIGVGAILAGLASEKLESAFLREILRETCERLSSVSEILGFDIYKLYIEINAKWDETKSGMPK